MKSYLCFDKRSYGTIFSRVKSKVVLEQSSGVFLFVMCHTHQIVGKIQEGGVGHSQQAVRRMSRLAEVREFA